MAIGPDAAGHTTADHDSGHTMRVGDQERQDVLDRLATALSLGQLDTDEFNDRVEIATRSKTEGDLSGLLDDLPQPPSPPQDSRLDTARRWAVTTSAIPAVRIATVVLLASLGLGTGAFLLFAGEGGNGEEGDREIGDHQHADGPAGPLIAASVVIVALLVLAAIVRVVRRRRR